MSTINQTDVLKPALANIDKKFQDKIIKIYLELKNRFSKSVHSKEFDSAGITAGKFTETIFRFLEHELKNGNYTPFKDHVSNIPVELHKLEQLPKANGNESLRVLIPRALNFLYTLRNKRGIGHVGGDIEANEIDAATIVKIADWIIVEMIRIYHGLSLEEAQGLIDSINIKSIPDVWEINGRKRILRQGLDFKEKVLLLLYTDLDNGIAVEDIFNWTEHSNISMFKKSVLVPLHKKSMIEYDKELQFVHLSPLGVKEVENNIIKYTT